VRADAGPVAEGPANCRVARLLRRVLFLPSLQVDHGTIATAVSGEFAFDQDRGCELKEETAALSPVAIRVKVSSLKRLTSILKSPRLWGLTATGIVLYFLVFVLFGKTDMSWIMPDTNQLARTMIDVWPRMPFFAVQKEASSDGDGTVVYYTVPTRQLSAKEIALMGMTNAAVHPAVPK
jgi:hypothetical protein